MDKKIQLVWITFNAFIDTDLYIVRELIPYYQITWYILKSGNDKFEYVNEIEEIMADSRVTVYRLQCGNRLRSLGCIPFYINILKEINKTNPDVIYTSLAGAPYFIPILIAKVDKRKLAVAIHNVHVPKGGSACLFFKWYNVLTIKAFNSYQTFSRDQFELLKSMIPKKKVCYIPFMLKDYGEARGRRIDHRITFLSFGNIREYKRIDVLIKAAQLAFEESKQIFRVIIAGKCNDWGKYQSLIKYHELFELHIERIENDMIPELFQEADYFVAPYQDIAQSGSSIVALNYGIPIIASRLPTFEEYVEDKATGWLIEPANIDSLKRVIIEIVSTNATGYTEMVGNLKKKRDELFSASAIVNQYKEFIDGIAETNDIAGFSK